MLLGFSLGTIAAGPSQAKPSSAEFYEQAIVARQAGDFELAANLFNEVVRRDPGNADAQVLLGYSLLALGDTQAAAIAFAAALDLAPDCQDARLGLAQIAFREGDRQRAADLVAIVLADQPQNGDAVALRDRLNAPPPPKWRLDINGEYHALTAGRPDWYEAVTSLSYAFDQGTVLGGTVRAAKRGSLTDTQLTGRVDHVFSPELSMFGSLGLTPDADFLPGASLAVGAGFGIWSNDESATEIRLNARIGADFYAGATVATARIGPQFSFFDGTLSLSTEWLHSWSDNGLATDGALARLDMRISEQLNGFVGYSYAPEIDGATIADTQNLFAGLAYDVNANLTLRAGAAHEFRAAFDRTTVSLGLTQRF